MTTSGDQPPGGFEPPPLDYPADSGLPPPVYPPPGFPPPGYPPPYPGQPNPGYYQPYPMNPPGTNGKAIAALVTSLAGLLCCGLPSIVGLVLGIIAMRETKSTGQAGYGLAVAAVAIGALVVAGIVLYLLLTMLLYASNWQWAP